jgi:hypothetical protein
MIPTEFWRGTGNSCERNMFLKMVQSRSVMIKNDDFQENNDASKVKMGAVKYFFRVFYRFL